MNQQEYDKAVKLCDSLKTDCTLMNKKYGCEGTLCVVCNIRYGIKYCETAMSDYNKEQGK